MFSPEAHARIDQLRAIAQQRSLTREEEAEVVQLIRGERKIAATVSAQAKAAKAKPDPAATLEKLKGLLAGIKKSEGQ